VGHDHNSAALAVELREVVHNLAGIVRVQVPSWFVGENDFGAVEQRPGQSDTLPLSGTELSWPMMQTICKLQASEKRRGILATRPRSSQGGEKYVFQAAEVRHQVKHLEDKADCVRSQPCPLARRHHVNVLIVDEHAPLGGSNHTPNSQEQCTLARAAGPAHCHKLARSHGESHVVQGADLTAIGTVYFTNIDQFNHCLLFSQYFGWILLNGKHGWQVAGHNA